MSEIYNSKDYTFVTACRDRLENLKKVIKSWSKEDPLQIIVVDWGSERNINLDDFDISIRPIIRILRFESPKWILTWAFNEGLSKVKSKYTVKLDCDHFIEEGFLKANQLIPLSFSAANWRYASANQSHINGAFLSCSNLLSQVGYFNERIATYGWDDSDLYKRLFEYTKKYQVIDSNYIRHIEQSEESRTSNQVIKIENVLSKALNNSVTNFMIRRNEILVDLYDYDWGRVTFENGFERKQLENNDNPKHLIFLELANLKAYIKIRNEIRWKTSGDNIKISEIINEYLIILYNNFPEKYLPINLFYPEIIERYIEADYKNDSILKLIIKNSLLIYSNDKEFIEKNLFKIDNLINNKYQISSSKSKPRLIVKPMHGLGNRLRVLASAYNIAKETNRELIICWDKDEHFNAEYYDLFKEQDLGLNITFTNSLILNNIHDLRSYNYMENDLYSHKDHIINTETDLDIFVISSSVLKSKFTDYQKENSFLSQLNFSNNVSNLINSINIDDNFVGVHIRYDGINWENLQAENISNWNSEAHELIKSHRNKSRPQDFESKMRNLLDNDINLKFFVSAANKDSISYITNLFSDKVYFLDTPTINNRDKLSLQYALADMILLSKCKHLLGSGWSSFTECAVRFSKQKQKVEIVGEDF